jgi:hypothetical protein
LLISEIAFVVCCFVETKKFAFHAENLFSKPIAYKVKTTAKKRYVVRPNTGIIQPNDGVDIQGLLSHSFVFHIHSKSSQLQ